MDSGCNNHMAKDETIFKSIDEFVKVKVLLENGSVVESKGKGTVMVETLDKEEETKETTEQEKTLVKEGETKGAN